MAWSSFDPVGQAEEVAERCREEPWFLGWLREVASDGVIPKERFLPEDMVPVLGYLAVLKPESGGEVVVRLWGERLPTLSGGDLTGSDIARHRALGVLGVAARNALLGRIVFAETLSAWDNGLPANWVLAAVTDGRVMALARWGVGRAGGPALRWHGKDQSKEISGSTPLSPGRRM